METSLMNSTFECNLKRLALFSPNAITHIASAHNIPPAPTSPEEIKDKLKALDFAACSVIYLFGVGQGEFYEALRDWLKDSGHFLVIFESHPSTMRALLETELGHEILTHSNVWLYFLDASRKTVEHAVSMFADLKFVILATPQYEKLYPQELRELHSTISFQWHLLNSVITEYQSFGSAYFFNYFQNLFLWPSSYLGSSLANRFAGVPAIICGAGPSLEKNGAFLASLANKALIFAGSTAMNALNGYGVLPHFGIGIDPNREQLTRIIINSAYQTPYFYRNRMYADALRLIHGDHLLISGSSGYQISQYFEERMGIEPVELDEGCNVVNFSLSIAAAMGCNPIICVGIDLAYSQQLSYPKGVISHPIFGGKEKLRTKSNQEELIYQNDIYGKPVTTLWKWVMESLWYSHFQISHPEITLINATEGGIGFAGVPNMTLVEAAEKYLPQTYDLEQRVFGEMQNCSMPADVNEENIEALLKELYESLQRTAQFLQDRLKEDWTSLAKDKEVDFFAVKDEELANALESEIAYRYLLQGLGDIFSKGKKRGLFRLKNDQELVSEEHTTQCKLALQHQKFAYLRQAACVLCDIINQVMAKVVSERCTNPTKVINERHEAAQVEVYSTENGMLRLYDPEIHLDYSAEFVPDERHDKMCLYYGNDRLKSETYYRAGQMHGPSSFYSEDGTLLSQSWFVEGKRQGKWCNYYPSGELHSKRKFREGLAQGRQEYYYKDGLLRATIDYKEGNLDGEVVLYYPNGMLKRKLTFINGKRNGMEQIYDEQGNLAVEAHFNDDLPCKSAKIWFNNGQLSLERIYDEHGVCVEIKKWSSNGTMLESSHGEETDYFKQVAQQTDVLTSSLTYLAKQLQQVSSLFTQGTGSSDTPSQMQVDLQALHEEMLKLQELNRKMTFESGLDPKNQQEAIWKTPSLEREMKDKVESATREMSSEIANLQTMLKKVIGDLKEEGGREKSGSKQE